MIADMAAHDPSGETNPVPLSAADYERILKAALHGDLPDWIIAGARHVA